MKGFNKTITPVTTPGIYHNASQGLISLSSDGTNWLTIADKNLGATQVYNSGDTLSEANSGKFYQWGNNYGFSWASQGTTSSTKVNAGTYGPGNYYSGNIFITASTPPYTWDNSGNQNLWGGTTGTNEAMQGPCQNGFHIAKYSEWETIINIGITIGAWTSGEGDNFKKYMKMPKAGRLLNTNGSILNTDGTGFYWTPIVSDTSTWNTITLRFSSTQLGQYNYYGAEGHSIRPFKNTSVQPDDGGDWEALYEPMLKFTANTAGSTVQLNKNGSPTSVTLETSTNLKNWSTYTFGDTITLANIGDKVYFRNRSETDTGFSTSATDYYRFVMTGSISASGDIGYLLNKNSTTTMSSYCFRNLFIGCTVLTSAPDLPATTLASYCYNQIFANCTSLATPPDLPATTLKEGCYYGMFNGSGIVTAPKISATTTAATCCRDMFRSCTNLTQLPKLYSLTLADNCYYQMFHGCSKIKLSTTQTGEYQTAYRIPTTGSGTTGTNSLQYMFSSTGGTFTGTPSINTTYYTSNTIV